MAKLQEQQKKGRANLKAAGAAFANTPKSGETTALVTEPTVDANANKKKTAKKQ